MEEIKINRVKAFENIKRLLEIAEGQAFLVKLSDNKNEYDYIEGEENYWGFEYFKRIAITKEDNKELVSLETASAKMHGNMVDGMPNILEEYANKDKEIDVSLLQGAFHQVQQNDSNLKPLSETYPYIDDFIRSVADSLAIDEKFEVTDDFIKDFLAQYREQLKSFN